MMKANDVLVEFAVRPLLADGAMGTQLMAAGLRSGACGMEWNVANPAAVTAIHAAYRDAGCNLITTNSFGGSAIALQRHGKADQVHALNLAAARLARAVAGDSGWVLGDVGPCGEFLEPLGELEPDDLRAVFRAQIQALVEGGADAILVETMSDPAEAVVGIEAARACAPGIPVIATFTFQKTAPGTYHTLMGTRVEAAVACALQAGASVIGANCGTALDLDDYVALCAQLVAAAGGAPVAIQPNAGSPQLVDGALVYNATPDLMAATASRLLDAGARLLGGCCGTAPAHLAAMARAVRAWG